jgi:multiple sugar transport system substrate-binding protein
MSLKPLRAGCLQVCILPIMKLVVLALIPVCTLLSANAGQPIRVLAMQDPFARVLSDQVEQAQAALGLNLDITLADYADSKRAIGINGARRRSAYDIIAIDAVWMGDLASQGILLELSDIAQIRDLDVASFISSAWESGQFAGEQLAIPIQPHPEVLIYRRSVLEALDETPPLTTEELVQVARRISAEIPNMDGICWNAASGAALGQQMLHFAGAFGFSVSPGQSRFSVTDAAWREAFEFAQSLVQVSPPMAQDMAWDRRIDLFRRGACGISYAWGARTARLESENSAIAGDIGYAAAPYGATHQPVTPLGVWLLSIPANLEPERIPVAVDALVSLTSPKAARFLLENGVSAVPRHLEGGADAFPVIGLVYQLNQLDQLSASMRPALPQFQHVSEIIGVEAHRALFGSASIDDAIMAIDRRLNRLWADLQ